MSRTRRWVDTSRPVVGLVEDDQRRPAGERHGQPDALLLAAGQLMRVPAQQVRRRVQGRLAEHLADPGRRVRAAPGVHPERLAELVADPQGRVQRRRRVLRHVADHGPAQRAQRRLEPEQVGAVQPDLPAGHGQAAPGVPEQGQGDRGLPGPGLADQAEHRPGPHRERDPADHRRPVPPAPDLQLTHFQALLALRLRGRFTRRLPSSLGRSFLAPSLLSPVGGALCFFAPPGPPRASPSLVARSSLLSPVDAGPLWRGH